MTARAKILKLPALGQQLVGMGEIPVSAIDNLLAIGEVSQPIVQAVVEAIATQQVGGSQLLNNAGWAIGQALRGAKGTFGEYLRQPARARKAISQPAHITGSLSRLQPSGQPVTSGLDGGSRRNLVTAVLSRAGEDLLAPGVRVFLDAVVLAIAGR